MGKVTWDKEQRDAAKRKGLELVCIAVDGSPAKRSGFAYHFLADKAIVGMVDAFFREMVKKQKLLMYGRKK